MAVNAPNPANDGPKRDVTSERWERITDLVGNAWELPPEARSEYLSRCCGSDHSLRREVEHLLAQLANSSGLLKSRFTGLPDAQINQVEPGDLLGRYRIEEQLGSGGMGVVFRATDTKLQRTVAVKVIRYVFTGDEQSCARFLQEAQMIAALNHPHIVAVYDTGSAGDIDFIVMEYVNGLSLDKLIAGGRLSLQDAVTYGAQVASALTNAHSVGIVHRDLKPGNVIVGNDGNAKVLDFGLAKRAGEPISRRAAAGAHVGELDELPSNLTRHGTLVGTVAYMSPEQARGESVDERTDVFSLGAMLFEMFSGRKPFSAATQGETLRSIINDQPASLRQFSGSVPQRLDELVSNCLQKDPGRRPQAAKAWAELRAIQGRSRRPRWLAGIALAATVVASLLFWTARTTDTKQQAHEMPSPARPLTSDQGDEIGATFSPDGTRIAFSARPADEAVLNLFERPIAGGVRRRLWRSDAPHYAPAWSPDGKWIASVQAINPTGAIVILPAAGGPPRTLVDLRRLPFHGVRALDWSPDSRWIAYSDTDPAINYARIYVVSPHTGESRMLLASTAEVHEEQPAFSPDGRMLAFTQMRDGVSQLGLLRITSDMTANGTAWTMRLPGFETALCDGPIWRPNGKELIFLSNKNGVSNHLWIVGVTGSEQGPKTPRMAGSLGERVNFPVMSRQGTELAFTRVLQDKNIWRVGLSKDQLGQLRQLSASTQGEYFPVYSPDGHRIAFESDRSGFPELWISNADGTNAFAVTNFRGPVTGSPAWSPDGRDLAFDTRASGAPQVYIVPAEPHAKARRLTYGAGDNILSIWSPDGKFVYFNSNRTGNLRVWRIPSAGGAEEPVTEGASFAPQISPEGRYLYYQGSRVSANSIRRFDLRDRKEETITNKTRDRSFFVTARGVYYIEEIDGNLEAIRFWNAKTKTDSVITRVQGRHAGGLSISPDHRFALIVKDDSSGSDLMLVDNFR